MYGDERGRIMVKKFLPVLGIALLLTVSCKAKVEPGTVEVKRQTVSGVTLAAVPLREVDSSYETAGTVRAKAVSVIAARTMGTVLSVKVKEGDRVSPGQELPSAGRPGHGAKGRGSGGGI